jgi:hypothetical protein
MATDASTVTSDRRLSTLGVLWALYGVSRLIIALVLVVFSGTATLMFGALLSRVPNPFALMSDFHLLYVCIIFWNILSGIVALVAAADLLGRRASARKVAILAAFIALPVPFFGIMLGVYTLFALFPRDVRRT